MSEWDALKAMVSGGFGARKGKTDDFGFGSAKRTAAVAPEPSPPTKPKAPLPASKDDEEEQIGPLPGTARGDATMGVGEDDKPTPGPLPASTARSAARGAASDSDEDDNDDEEEVGFDSSALPVSNDAVLRAHQKSVTALALDPSGNRLLTGSADYTVKFWDFSSMDSGLRSFRSIEPAEGCHIRDLCWSTTGDSFLVATTSAMPRLHDREGTLIFQYAKGDQYLSDMRNTSGHIASVSTARFHPFDKTLFITAAADSTVRIWDVGNKRKQKEVIVFKSKMRGSSGGGPAGLRTVVTAANFSPDGRMIAAAAQDGTLRMYPTGGPFINPAQMVDGAHMANSECGSLTWSLDNRTLLTRATDDTMKMWDLRNFKQPLHQRGNLPALMAEHNAVFSPDEKVVVTGTAARKDGVGKLVFVRREDFSVIREVDVVPSGSAIRVMWNAKINQIIVGGSDANAHILWDPSYSIRGITGALGRRAKHRAVDDISYLGPILTPDGDLADDFFVKKRPRDWEEKPKVQKNYRRPDDASISGQGRGGKVGTSLSEVLYRSVVPRNERAFEDAREALLKHAEEAEKNPQFISKAYEKTQPKPVFDERALEDEAAFGRAVKRRGMILKPSDIDRELQNNKK